MRFSPKKQRQIQEESYKNNWTRDEQYNAGLRKIRHPMQYNINYLSPFIFDDKDEDIKYYLFCNNI